MAKGEEVGSMEILVDANEWLDEHARKTGRGRLPGATIRMIGVLPHGLQSGAPSAMLAIELDEETRKLCGGTRVIFAQTSIRSLVLAAMILNEKYPQQDSPIVFAAAKDTATIMHVPEGSVGVIAVVPESEVEKPDPAKSN